MATFNELMLGFGVVTVMDAKIYAMKDGYSYVDSGKLGNSDSAFTPDLWVDTGEVLDTLKIANITQEGPTKTITGGQYSNPLIKYGKTATMEMQDALGRASTLVRFFGCAYDASLNRLSVTDKFPGPFAIEGKTFFIDQKTGDKVTVHVFIPQFIPDAILTLTQDAEGDATVFDLNGSLGITRIADDATDTARDVFYEIRETSFFANSFAGISIQNKAGTTKVGATGTFTVRKGASVGDITWSSSNPEVITVNEDTGAYQAIAEGEAVIIAQSGTVCDSFEIKVKAKQE